MAEKDCGLVPPPFRYLYGVPDQPLTVERSKSLSQLPDYADVISEAAIYSDVEPPIFPADEGTDTETAETRLQKPTKVNMFIFS